jgi:ABC-2 type transport system ATP-binding protein
MILLQQLTRRFGALTAVDRIDLEVRQGEIFGLVGPDGAGKTTTLRMLCGLLDPTEGAVTVNGLDVGRNIDAVKDQLGYMAQRFGLYGDLTVQENMEFYGDLFGVTGAEREKLMTELLEMTRMTPFRERPAAKLSGGMKQKLALMCTLLHHPRVLVLDEPTNGVDPVSRRDFWAILYRLAKEGMTVLVTTAYLDEAERCGRVGLMNKGRLIQIDTPQAMRETLAPFCFAITTDNSRAAREFLGSQPDVLSAEPAGARLHLYMKEHGVACASLEARLHAAGFGGASVQSILPALEDVFIERIRREERHESN